MIAEASWRSWSTSVHVLVTERQHLDTVVRLTRSRMAAVDLAASRFRADSELTRINDAHGVLEVSPLFAELLAAALAAAGESNGLLDPTVGGALRAAGYDCDIDVLRAEGPRSELPGGASTVLGSTGSWRSLRLEGTRLSKPKGVELDLGATAKAVTADAIAEVAAAVTGAGVLVNLGGDIATAGSGPAGGWQVRVQDSPGEPASVVALADGWALATSSTLHRTWQRRGRPMHHILDPATGAPARPVWRTVSVVAPTALEANRLTTAAVIEGHRAPARLRASGRAARLVGQDGHVLHLGGWPEELARTAA